MIEIKIKLYLIANPNMVKNPLGHFSNDGILFAPLKFAEYFSDFYHSYHSSKKFYTTKFKMFSNSLKFAPCDYPVEKMICIKNEVILEAQRQRQRFPTEQYILKLLILQDL